MPARLPSVEPTDLFVGSPALPYQVPRVTVERGERDAEPDVRGQGVACAEPGVACAEPGVACAEPGVACAEPVDGPVRDALGRHAAPARPEPPRRFPYRTELHAAEAARRRAFARWLDQQRAERIRPVPGLEHPGDPRRPDNHHKH
ncbi:hypothetical protein [Nonomuraea sp. NPDC005501]|uniref:hypothetical protein n=1 Tax=Nonomuraea sp. NPDC005501 TaxID=3156884 RepID=UPI0033BC4DA0